MSLRLYYDSCHISIHFKKLFKIGEFLCSHFNIKIEKQHFWHIMFYYLFIYLLYYFKRGKNATEMQKKICAVYGECAVTDQMCQKWPAKFCAWYFFLGNALLLGMPVEVDRDYINTLKTNNAIPADNSKYSNISCKILNGNRLHQLGYVNHLDMWVSQKLSKKNPSWPYFCTQFST